MVECTCGRKIDKIPSWMDVIKVEFVCDNCAKSTQSKNIAHLKNEQLMPIQPDKELSDEDEISEDELDESE